MRYFGSTVDTLFFASVCGFVFWRNAWFGSGYNVVTVFVFQRNAWFDCGCMFCDSLRSYFSAMLGSSVDTWFAS